jgi:hypothetical protein
VPVYDSYPISLAKRDFLPKGKWRLTIPLCRVPGQNLPDPEKIA